MHLRDAHYRSAERIGHGVGYRYPHDDPTGAAGQHYRPEALEGHVYYEPRTSGDRGGADVGSEDRAEARKDDA